MIHCQNFVDNVFVCLSNQDNWGSGYYLMSRCSRFYCRWFVDVTGVQSSWLSCVVALPINTDLGWSMWVHGFSLAFWLRLHPTPSPPQPPDLYSDSSQSDTWCTDTGQYFHLHRYLWLLRAYSPTIVFYFYLLISSHVLVTFCNYSIINNKLFKQSIGNIITFYLRKCI